jgi:hypothetical protein
MLEKSILLAIVFSVGVLGGILAMSLFPSRTVYSQENRRSSIAAVPAAPIARAPKIDIVTTTADETGIGQFIGTGDNSAGSWSGK